MKTAHGIFSFPRQDGLRKYRKRNRMSENNLPLTLLAREGEARPIAEDRASFDIAVDLPSTISPPLAALEPADTNASVTLELREELASLEPEWTAFQHTAACTVFQTFEWLTKWQQHVGNFRGTRPAIVLGRDASGALLFILPLAIETRGSIRRLTWLGSDLCDYNAPLIARDFWRHIGDFTALWREAQQLLQGHPRLRFDFVDLQKMAETVGGERNPLLSLSTRRNASSAHVATLGGSWDEFYKTKRSSETRKKERKQLRRLGELGDVRFIDVSDKGEIGRTIETLMQQKSKTFARMGVEDLFARPGYRAFWLDVTATLRGVTHVSRLDVGSTIAATSLGLTHRGCYYLVLSSYHDGEVMRFGPGRAHLHELLRHAIEQGMRDFDFTIGDEPYKRDWADVEVRLYDHLQAATLRGAVVVAMISAFRRTKRLIKTTPALWHAYSKARELARFLRQR
jgi:CelD/BcsL family acetyltransferase involved in cellulose biosynthesis